LVQFTNSEKFSLDSILLMDQLLCSCFPAATPVLIDINAVSGSMGHLFLIF
jgi:hypothetical protein